MNVFAPRWAVWAVVCVGLAGCATIEFSHPPEMPEVQMRPAEGVDHPSPPPLAGPDRQTPVAPEPAAEKPEPLGLTVEAAIAMALEHNQALKVEQVNPVLASTAVAEQRAVFDPTLAGAFARTRNRVERDLAVQHSVSTAALDPDIVLPSHTVTSEVEQTTTNYVTSGSIGIDELFPTGTLLSFGVTPSESSSRSSTSNPFVLGVGSPTDSDTARVEMSVTQRLLKGGGLGVNLASLRQARMSYQASGYELRGFVQSLVAQVESAYWDYYLAEHEIEICEESLRVAEEQAAEVESRIQVGKVAETERAAAAAEVAQRRSLLIDARSNMSKARLALLRLLNPSSDAFRSTEVRLVSEPLLPDIALDEVDSAVRYASRMRPDLNQARLLVQRNELQLVQTRNGLLPQLDLVLSLSQELTETDYARPLRAATRDLEDDTLRTDVGLQLNYPLGNRAARARHHRAVFTKEQSLQALANLEQSAEQDVRGAFIELSRAREQVAATEATLQLQKLTAQTELEKFRLGKSTTLLVAQAQRDLLAAQIDAVKAVTAFLKSIVNLYYTDGSLLLRRGVDCPGVEPVALDSGRRGKAVLNAGEAAD